MNLDLIKNNTKWEEAANSINSNFNKTNLELTKIAASSVKHKGYFTTEAALLAAQPSPKVGDNAYVGATYPGVVYICNTAGMWTATTTVPSPPAVNISEYYKKTETDAIVATVESNINSLESDLNEISSETMLISECLEKKVGTEDVIENVDAVLGNQNSNEVLHALDRCCYIFEVGECKSIAAKDGYNIFILGSDTMNRKSYEGSGWTVVNSSWSITSFSFSNFNYKYACVVARNSLDRSIEFNDVDLIGFFKKTITIELVGYKEVATKEDLSDIISPLVPTRLEFNVNQPIGSSMVRIQQPFKFKKGNKYIINVVGGDEYNTTYFQVKNEDKSINLQTYIGKGIGDRSLFFECNFDGGEHLGIVILSVVKNSIYFVDIYDVSLDGVSDRLFRQNIINEQISSPNGYNVLPSYHASYLDRYMSNLLIDIDENDFCISFVSDLHIDNTNVGKQGPIHALMSVNDVCKSGLSNLLILGGDYANTTEGSQTNQMSTQDFYYALNICKKLTSGARSRLFLRGNHELKELISTEKFKMFSKEVYGFIDFDDYKIRVIYFDTSGIDYLGDDQDQQLLWMGRTAFSLGVKSDYHVVIVSHEPLVGPYSPQWAAQNSYKKLISAFHRGSDISIFGETYNYSSQGEIPMFYIAGHVHADLIWDPNAEADADFITITTVDTSTSRNQNHKMALGYVDESSFDTYVINTMSKTVNIHRYGLGYDRTFNYD